MKALLIESSAFKNNQKLPKKYTCDGKGINPTLTIKQIPEETKSLALTIEDPGAPSGTYYHWIVWNIKPTLEIQENSIPGTEGTNTSGKTSYHPPCPPSGTHRYIFTVFALDSELTLQKESNNKELRKAIENHIIAKGELTALYR